MKDQSKRAEEDRKNLENQKKMLNDKESRLEANMNNLETEITKRVEVLRAQFLKEGKSAELVKLLIVSAVCLLVGMLVARFALKLIA